jgi:hypothetical protein
MTNFDELLNSFQAQENAQHDSPLDLFNSTPERREPTPEERDLERLEDDIRSIFEGRKFLNKAIATFLGCAGANGSVQLLAQLGLPALASSSIGAILVGLFFANALTKIRVSEGRPSIEQNFLVGIAQTCGVTGALWQAFDEYRQISHQSRVGREQFFAEVKAYEVKPSPPPDNSRWLTAGVGVTLLVLAIALMFKGGKKSGY